MISEPSSGIPPTMRYYTSHQVGTILQVNPSSVVKWINDGLLRAFRTPGGHRRVTAGELVRFASYHGMPIPEDLRDLADGEELLHGSLFDVALLGYELVECPD